MVYLRLLARGGIFGTLPPSNSSPERLKQYIEQKTLPFELDSKVIKYKIL